MVIISQSLKKKYGRPELMIESSNTVSMTSSNSGRRARDWADSHWA